MAECAFRCCGVGPDESSAVRRRDLVNRVLHSWHSRIDPEDRLAFHDPGAVDAHHRPADDGELLGSLERHRIQIRRSQGCRR
jgi:hypothetical protein